MGRELTPKIWTVWADASLISRLIRIDLDYTSIVCREAFNITTLPQVERINRHVKEVEMQGWEIVTRVSERTTNLCSRFV